MATLLLRLEGPMQAWGTQSRFEHRDTNLEPSRSGVVGILCAALGVARDDEARIAELSALPMAVRADREGVIQRDYHTAGGGDWPGRKRYGVYLASGKGTRTVVSQRWYLADASFLVALEGDEARMAALDGALRDPVWPLFLGRRAFLPSLPLWVPGGVRAGGAEETLRTAPWLPPVRGEPPRRLRLVVECGPDEGRATADQPITFASGVRRFATRYVRTDWIATDGLDKEAEPCISHG